MMDMIKKQGLSFWLSAFAAVLALIGIITMAIGNGVAGYSMNSFGGLIVAAIAVIVLLCAGVFLKGRVNDIVVTIINLAALVLLMVAFMGLILERAVLATAQFSYDAVNEVGWMVLTVSIISMVCYFLGAIALIISSFLKVE